MSSPGCDRNEIFNHCFSSWSDSGVGSAGAVGFCSVLVGRITMKFSKSESERTPMTCSSLSTITKRWTSALTIRSTHVDNNSCL